MEVNRETWQGVDQYFGEALFPHDPILAEIQENCRKAGLPMIEVSPAQGQLLRLLALQQQPKRILEIGTLGGYSTVCMARALPADGKLVTVEVDTAHAAVAEKNFEIAEVSKHIDIRIGKGLTILEELEREEEGPFDFVFIDADKANIPGYFEASLKLSRKGTMIVVDNVVRGGKVLDGETDAADIVGVRKFRDQLAENPNVSATIVQTVGSKGYDGFVLAVVS